MKCYVFAYGTLLDPRIRRSVLGYTTALVPSGLKGFRRQSITLSGVSYPVLVADPGNNGTIEGCYFEISETDLEKLDLYESSAYNRMEVNLENGTRAWVYCLAE
jgi:gamma-glutamylcyclotransferase (GGCT)/AIG2-like uncharacterized protein YtfP